MKTGWQYKLRNFTKIDVGVFENYFKNMPFDPYVKGDFRKRRFSSIKKDHFGNFEVMPHKKFIQSSNVNDLLGDVEREYDELELELIYSAEFKKIVDAFTELTGVNMYLTEVGIHQMRVLSSLYIKGEPAPEGRHKDGFDYIGIFCARRSQVSGAKSELFLNKDDEKPILEKILGENEMLIVNDREVYHNATKLNPTGTDCGYRDVFVFTA